MRSTYDVIINLYLTGLNAKQIASKLKIDVNDIDDVIDSVAEFDAW